MKKEEAIIFLIASAILIMGGLLFLGILGWILDGLIVISIVMFGVVKLLKSYEDTR